MDFQHIPVMLYECLHYLNCHPNGIYVDGTLGGGGHSEAILKIIGTNGQLIGIDRDPNAIEAASRRLEKYTGQFTAVHDNYIHIKSILQELGISQVDGMLLDLGVSSHQLDTGERGFSYQEDAPLDMRMNPQQKVSAYHIVNEYSADDLHRVIREYGEENWAKRIAQFIVSEREREPIATTTQLVEIIKKAIPAKARRNGPHPAKRTFQAIRIEVNSELEPLGQAIKDAVDVLKPGGRLCIISFHSLEDRIVKKTFHQLDNPCICPPKSPICTCGRQSNIRLLTRKPILPQEAEIQDNSRARSAKLRALEKR